MKKNNLMYVKEIHNKRGDISLELHAGYKDPFTKKFKVKVKTYRVPIELKGKKELEEFSIDCQRELKKEVDRISKGILTTDSNKIIFSDYAEKWVERIKLYNKNSYNYYADCVMHLKVLKEKFGLYTLSEMTLPVIQHFCDWLCKRTYNKEIVVVKQSLREKMAERKMPIAGTARAIGVNENTVANAITVGKHVTKETANKLCDYVGVNVHTYFDIQTIPTPYSKTANKGLKVMLHGILGSAVRDGLIPINYASQQYTKPVVGTVGKKEIYSTMEEIQEFLDCVEKEPDIRKRVAFSIAINLGLRGAEISGLEWKDFDFENSTVFVNKNTMYVYGFGIITKGTKNQSSTRKINVPSSLLNLLLEYREWWEQEKLNHGDLWANTDKLFVQNNGNDMANSTIAIWLKRFQSENNLKRVTLHGLRHTNITMQIVNGVDIKTVSARAGHSDIQTTLNIYSHHTNESDKYASDMIENLLYGKRKEISV